MSSSRFLAGFLTGAVASFTLVYLLTVSVKRSDRAATTVGDDGGTSTAARHDGQRQTGGTSENHSTHHSHHGQHSCTSLSDGFVSNLIHELWGHIDLYLASTIRETVEPMLAETLPTPLNSLKFTRLSLGKNPIRLENFNVVQEDSHPRGSATGTIAVKLYVDVSWHARCDIHLAGSMGMAMGVECISFRGRLVCLLFPMSSSPILSAVNVSFLNVPSIHLDFTGLASVADVRMIKRKVTQSIQKSIEAVMVLPTSILFRIDASVRFVDVYRPPRGILRVTLRSGHGFQAEKRIIFGQVDVVDVYCVFSVGDKIWTSSTVNNSLTPTWNESVDFLYHDVEQALIIHAWDRDQGSLDSDDHLGGATIAVREALSASNGGLGVELMTSSDPPQKSGIVLELLFDPLALIPDCSSLTKASWDRDHLGGVLEILVVAAHDLSIPKAGASTHVKVKVGTHEFLTSTVVDAPGIDALHPHYDSGFVVPIHSADDIKNDVLFTLYNSHATIGSHSVPIQSLLEEPDRFIECQQSLSGREGTNRLEFCLWIRGTDSIRGRSRYARLSTTTSASPRVLIPHRQQQSAATSMTAEATQDSPSSSRGSAIPESIVARRPPLGTVRVTVLKGFGFRPHRRIFRKADVLDAYCQVDVHDAGRVAAASDPAPWRTKTARDSVNPVWDESREFFFHDESDVITVSVYVEDRQPRSPDHDFIGSGRIAIAAAEAMSSPPSSSSSPSRSPAKRVPIDLAITRKGKGTVAYVSILVAKHPA